MAKKTKKATHGGIRKGAGRPQKFSEPVKVKGVKLPESLVQWMESQEGKTFSDVALEAIQFFKKHSERKKK